MRSKFRLTVLNETSFEELFSTRLTPMNVIIIFGALLVVFGSLIYVLVALTPLRQYVVKDYTGHELRESARVARFQADSLTTEMRAQEKYINHLRIILSGGTVPEKLDTAQVDSSLVQLNYSLGDEEKALREKISGEDRYSLDLISEQTAASNALILFKPLDGTISQKFNPKKNHYGVDLVAPRDAVVKSVLDGTVILSTFTADGGNILHIQHTQNLVSVYQHNSVLFKKTGELVSAGESIAIIGESGEESDGPHLHFELWQNGVPVDPLNFLVFGE